MMSIIETISKSIITAFFSVFFAIIGKPKAPQFMKKGMKLYETGDFSQFFQTIRIWDAPYENILESIPTRGVVIDLGCGDGLLANSIALSRPKLSVFGIDLNKKRIKEANKGVTNAKFVAGDIVSKDIPMADVIILSHVFHHLLSRSDQEKLLAKCIKKLKKGGKLLIIEIDTKPFLKYLLTYFVDVVIVPILFEGRLINTKIFYRSEKEWMDLFKKNKLSVKACNGSEGKPFSHVIFLCRKD